MTHNPSETSPSQKPGPLEVRCLAWAREQLQVGEDASAGELRAALWAQLGRDAHEGPDASWVAFRYLQEFASGRSPAELPPEFLELEEERGLEAVGRFAREMFQLEPVERRRQWERLSKQCEPFPRPTAHLAALAPGLDADLSAIPAADTEAVELASHLCDMLATNPFRRGPWRRRMRRRWADDPVAARRLAERFRWRYPQFAALDPPLINQLAAADTPTDRIAAGISPKAQPAPEPGPGEASDGSSFGGIAAAILIAIVAIVRIAATESQRQDRRRLEEEHQQRQMRQRFELQRRFQRDIFTPPRPTLESPRTKEILERIRESREERERSSAETHDANSETLGEQPILPDTEAEPPPAESPAVPDG